MSSKSVAPVKPKYVLAAESLRGNDGQWLAYSCRGNCVINAGPGSGKTKTLTLKLAKMLAEDVAPPRGIACITYNNQCARELRKRLAELGVEDGIRVSIGTVHSFCLQHIIIPFSHLTSVPIKYPITVASTSEIIQFQEKAVTSVLGFRHWDASFDKYRRKHLDRRAPEWRSDDADSAQVIEKYESLLSESGLIDFDGMILIGLHLVETYPWIRKALITRFPVIVVDEYQDLGHALDRLIQCLCFKAGARLVAVGDPDQSIYGFTGAEPTLLQKLFGRTDIQPVQLRMNYRCGSAIIRASEAALGENRGFISGIENPGIILFHERRGGIVDQASFVCEVLIPEVLNRGSAGTLGDIAVLYLDKHDGNVIAEAVSKTDWKFIRVDSNNPYDPSPVTYWLEDCAAWCAGAWRSGKVRLSELIHQWNGFNERVTTEKGRLNLRSSLVKFLWQHRDANFPLNKWLSSFLEELLMETLEQEPRLRDDKVKVEKLLKNTLPKGPLKNFTVAFFGGQGGSPEHLNLTTLHSAKGLEYNVVIMIGLEEGRIPYYSDSHATVREKRRLFYVGLTRARYEVHLVYSGWYEARNGRVFSNGRSRFIDEVEEKIS